MNIEKMSFDDIRPSEYNPRTMTKEEFEGLKESIKKFGQTENLIVNKDGTLISGHMRMKAMQDLGYSEADVALVDLDKSDEKKLNLVMNSQKISGKYDDIKLEEVLESIKLESDYKKLRLDKLEPLDLSDKQEDDEAEFEYSKELHESHNYLVLYFDNDIDWQTATDLFEIKSVHDIKSKPGYLKKGIGRVLNGGEAIQKIRNSNT